MQTINGVAVACCYQVPSLSNDDALDGATIIGRAHVDFPQGGRAHGLLVTFGDPCEQFAVVWERTTSRFVLVAVDAEARMDAHPLTPSPCPGPGR
jgi:hypothetical protein